MHLALNCLLDRQRFVDILVKCINVFSYTYISKAQESIFLDGSLMKVSLRPSVKEHLKNVFIKLSIQDQKTGTLANNKYRDEMTHRGSPLVA